MDITNAAQLPMAFCNGNVIAGGNVPVYDVTEIFSVIHIKGVSYEQ
jgi:hypothetical protein